MFRMSQPTNSALIRFDTPKKHGGETSQTENHGVVRIPIYVIREILFGSILNSYKF